ncbi:probable protein arginine N-methyltransferase 3 [Euphorbia lathyris]|uniref:probable protein arginine N-methyltransferase 3 n=1 Tax=Euphorbia lathyris TaxID=212925 RepID=UPI0033142834
MAKKDQTEFNQLLMKVIERDSEEEEEIDEDWDDWKEDDGEEGLDLNFLCLFCDAKFGTCSELFDHCGFTHRFNFMGIRKELKLDFYCSFKLINYVRSEVSENRCWSCRATCESIKDLQNHLHEAAILKDVKQFWDDDKYLKPIMEDDSLLYSFTEDEEGEDDITVSMDKEELIKDLANIKMISLEDDNSGHNSAPSSSKFEGNGMKEVGPVSKGPLNLSSNNIEKVNESYFGSYSSFCIHREMISDEVRMDAYRQAILKNPSLLTGAIVMDVGCGTGILSLFAVQGGASRVIAVEASEKMAAVANRIAKENGLSNEGNNHSTGVIDVVQGMVEELDKSIQIEPHSIDVIVSEWMGYCLLYESMLDSVLFARDKWLKPGGAILPDTATIYAAGFGRGGTSLAFWEDVYGFTMSCVGKEIFQDAARFPIVDVVDDSDLVTDTALLQSFDLATMKPTEVDFTRSIELEPKLGETKWCYGAVLWFDTGFSSRFCKENPAVLSTSPYTHKTHWSQTILTFRKPIAIAAAKHTDHRLEAVGTEACPAARIHLRISIVRGVEHRSIDISMETVGIGPDGRKCSQPVQIFNIS